MRPIATAPRAVRAHRQPVAVPQEGTECDEEQRRREPDAGVSHSPAGNPWDQHGSHRRREPSCTRGDEPPHRPPHREVLGDLHGRKGNREAHRRAVTQKPGQATRHRLKRPQRVLLGEGHVVAVGRRWPSSSTGPTPREAVVRETARRPLPSPCSRHPTGSNASGRRGRRRRASCRGRPSRPCRVARRGVRYPGSRPPSPSSRTIPGCSGTLPAGTRSPSARGRCRASPGRVSRRAMPRISLIIPMLNEQENVPALIARLADVERLHDRHEFEFVMVDDGSIDGTGEAVLTAAPPGMNLRLLTLSRNFGSHPAASAGLDHCTGDAAILIGADLQEPPELITRFLEQWKGGCRGRLGDSRAAFRQPRPRRPCLSSS